MRRILYKIRSYILIVLLIQFYNCNYDERGILKDEGITQRIVYSLNSKHSTSLEKEALFLDYFNDSGRLIKRADYKKPEIYRLYDYDSSGKVIIERSSSDKMRKHPRFEIYYIYDDFGNLIYKGYKHSIPKYQADYYDNNKLKTLILFDKKGKYSEIFSFSYDWKGDMSEKLEVIYKHTVSKLNKIEYKYNMAGRLKTKKIFTREFLAGPIIKNGRLLITDPLDKEYKLKYIYEYNYNDDNLLEEEVKCAPLGYVLEKTIFEYL